MAAARHAAPSSRASMRLGIGLVVVVAAAGAFVIGRIALRGDPAASTGPTETETELAVPRFSFRLEEAKSVTTTAKARPDAAVRQTASVVRAALTDLYRNAFLDPAQWQEGTFAAALDAFDTDAYGDAQRDLELLTLGAGAGYDRVEPVDGTVSVTVLLDADGSPVTAEATVSFSALAMGPTGGETSIVSAGSFFFRSTPEGWKIYGYEVERADEPAGGGA